MSEKKKLKLKQRVKVIASKQNRNKQQIQNVTVNVISGRRSSKSPKTINTPQTTKPKDNFNYEMFRNLTTYAQQLNKPVVKTVNAVPALYSNQPLATQPSFVENLINKSNLFNKPNIPTENTNKASPSPFDNVLFTPSSDAKEDANNDEEDEEDNVKLEALESEDESENKVIMPTNIKPRPTTPAPSGPPTIRFTAKGLPRRKTKEEKEAYDDYVENVIGNKPLTERTKEEYKAYEAYLESLGKQKTSIKPFLRPRKL